MKNTPAIVWFRLDLRLADNPALHAAIQRDAVIPVFIHAPEEEAPWPPGGATKWWLHQSLRVLDASLRECGSRLILRRGPALETLRALIQETGAGAVFWNRRYEPAVIARDARVKESLRVLEEVTKLIDVGISKKLKVLRYKVYELEQKVICLC